MHYCWAFSSSSVVATGGGGATLVIMFCGWQSVAEMTLLADRIGTFELFFEFYSFAHVGDTT